MQNQQICVAEAVSGHELIGKTVYFEAIRALKVGANRPRGPPGRGNKPFYDMIPGEVLHLTPSGVVLKAAGNGIYNRTMADIVLGGDLDRWMRQNPNKLVLVGEA